MTGAEYIAQVKGQAEGLDAPACRRGCGRPAAPGRKSCASCLAKTASRATKQRKAKREAGLCAWSGCDAPADEGVTLCKGHRAARPTPTSQRGGR